jgi:hypothetical protein
MIIFATFFVIKKELLYSIIPHGLGGDDDE